MTITQSNLFSQSYSELSDFLKENITDPRARYKSNWVHASRPNINSKGFSGYPYMIVTIDVNEDKKSNDGVTSEKTFRAIIQVISNESTEVDTISDSIVGIIKDEDKLTSFKSRTIASSPFSWNFDDKGTKIYARNIGFIGRVRI